jgi:class 3 adenylate cyclase
LNPKRHVERNVGVDGINIAARLGTIAEPRAICLSEEAPRRYRHRPIPGIRIDPHRRRQDRLRLSRVEFDPLYVD